MKFMSWSLNEPSNAQFQQYAVEVSEGQWEVVDPEAFAHWGGDQKNFWIAFMNHHESIDSFGLHDIGVNPNGTLYNYKAGTAFPVLNESETEILNPLRHSLRYLLDHYPKVRWFLQVICFGPNNVNPMLDNENNQQDTFIRQLGKVIDLYMQRFPDRFNGIEVDFEKSNSRPREFQEPEKYRDLLKRVKDEICIPRGLKLRVNLHAMTGDFNPSWYAWTDYRTLTTRMDRNGQFICDEWQIMSYDFAHNNSAPGPSTPVWWLTQVINHCVDVFPPKDVWIGNAAYGRRWPLDSNRSGVAVRYHQLLEWQNGLNKHNLGRIGEDQVFTWVDQAYIPFTGFHDDESGYQRTFLHCYDRFEVGFANLHRTYNGNNVIFRATYGGQDYITSYVKYQKPKFEGIQLVKTDRDTHSGNVTQGSTWSPSDTFPNRTFRGYLVGGRIYAPDHDNETCVVEEEQGRLIYNLNLSRSGRYRLIAVVQFPYLNCRIRLNINGSSYVIGDDIPDWYPLMVNPARHFYDCGSWDFNTSNTIEVLRTEDSAQIMGFIVCNSFDHGMTGGEVSYNVNLQPYVVRDRVREDGIVTKKEADFPSEMTLTGELLRRPPRPAIFWEDLFAPFINDNIDNLAETRYYQRAMISDGGSGSGTNYNGGRCTSAPEAVGYSNGTWVPDDANNTDDAYVFCDARGSSAQLVLYKDVKFNPHIEADFRGDSRDRNVAYGIRFFAHTKGTSNNGYLFLADHSSGVYRLIYESNGSQTTLATANMGLTLGNRYSLRVRYVNGSIRCMVGQSTVLSYSGSLPETFSRGAHGVYVRNGRARCYRFHLATNDRYEPMEKVSVIVDGQEISSLEEDRPYQYDELGYYIHTGFETDETNIDISNDYVNLPIATVPSWRGAKNVTIRLADAGVWLRRFYVGDAKGYSIAWNSDLEGFITTLGMINDYGCRGVAMWTMGQEDPRVFTYLPDAN
ncbi:glycoside hydrolase [Halalkalibacterium halodurans]|uniref:glycoside hydrolase n=1 Tax=Halalkalibacterium halodurans TaxID=86665 RepID=UPI002E2329E9|nr:glycoside hydrolase [Halalkalibacterium halodurans]